MDKVQILLIVNSFLLAILSILFLVIGYFLKDLHKDFKTMVERVNTLYTDHQTHVVASNAFDQQLTNRVSNLYRKVKKLQRGADTTASHESPCS